MPPLSDLYTTIYNAVTFAAFTALIACAIILILLLLAGIIWSPFATLICARMARRRALPAAKYALAACSYSAQFLIPWTYLITVLHGNPTGWETSRRDYILIYTLWAGAALGTFGALMAAFLPGDFGAVTGLFLPNVFGPFSNYAQSGTDSLEPRIAAPLIALAANVFLFQKNLRDLRRKRHKDRHAAQKPQNPRARYAPPTYALPDKAYTRPFSMTLLGSSLIALAWFALLPVIAELHR